MVVLELTNLMSTFLGGSSKDEVDLVMFVTLYDFNWSCNVCMHHIIKWAFELIGQNACVKGVWNIEHLAYCI